MLEVNPVLAGKFDAPDYAPAATNLSTNDIDTRRYTKFDRTASSVQSADFSFSDLVDTINPLQHIPVLSSLYRAITGEDINPVARIAGDTLYGGIMGGASALLAAAGAISDSALEAATGKSASGNIVAALFGTDDALPASAGNPVQLAAATQTAPDLPPSATVNSNPVDSSPVDSSPVVATAVTAPEAAPEAPPKVAPLQTASAAPASAPAPALTPDIKAAQEVSMQLAKAYPLAINKLPYGGVMDTSRLNPIASARGTQLGDRIYPTNNMKSQSAYALPVAAPVASTTTGNQSDTAVANVEQYQLPKALLDDIAALKALNQYQNTAAAPVVNGSSVNVLN